MLQLLLLVLEQVLVDGILGGRDLVRKHGLPEHEEGKDVGVAQDAPRMEQLILSLHAGKAHIIT